jgi:hypothetical protein
MLNASPNRSARAFFLCLACCLGMAGCASNIEKPPEVVEVLPRPPHPVSGAPRRIAELERQLAERQRQCADEKRRHELALKENQLRTEELQKKLDALLVIDRELRSRGKDR